MRRKYDAIASCGRRKNLSDALVTVLKHHNYSVDAVYNGQDALDYLTEGDNYDGAILDIMMPKPPMPSFPLAMSGWTEAPTSCQQILVHCGLRTRNTRC